MRCTEAILRPLEGQADGAVELLSMMVHVERAIDFDADVGRRPPPRFARSICVRGAWPEESGWSRWPCPPERISKS